MELTDILSISVTALVMLVLTHIAVFWVVRTLYPPPAQAQAPVRIAQPVKTVTFTEPPVVEQHVDLPTYEAPLPGKAPGQEGERKPGPPPPESTAIQREPRVDVSNTQ